MITRKSVRHALVCILFLYAGAAQGAGVVFRYLPGSPSLSSTFEFRNVEPGPFLDPRERIARGPGGWGYDPAWAGEFEAPGSVLWGAAAEDANQPLGPDITAEVWVRLLEVGEFHTLLTNRVGGSDGFTIGVRDGIPFFEIVVDGAVYRVDGSNEIVAGEDVWLAATAEYASSELGLALYHNGVRTASADVATSIPTPYVIRHPFFVGTEASGSDDAPQLTGSVTGLVYAATVRNYVAKESYLDTPPPFDGSTYFGLPDFHDYETDSFEQPMDQRIDSYPTPVRQKFYLPHVNDEFIPQGTAVVSDEATGEAELVYVAYYHRTRDDRLRVQNSIVAEIDAATGAVRRTLRLTGRLDDSHAGGIAIAGGALFVSSGSYVERYPIPAYDPEAPRYLDLTADDAGSSTVQSKASFVSEFADTLWVGDYRTASEQQPYLYGYPLDSSGKLIRSASPVIYPIPRRVQGVDLFTQDGTTFVFMSRNRNSDEGEVLRFRRSDLDPINIPSWEASITFAHGIEDLAFTDSGTLWTNAESGTDFYQRNVQWSSFYPYVYGVDRSGVLPPSTAAETPPDAPERFGLQAYPNPVSDRLEIGFRLDRPAHVRARVIDSLGREVAILVDGTRESGSHRVSWTALHAAPGVYLIVVEAGEQRRFQTVTVIR